MMSEEGERAAKRRSFRSVALQIIRETAKKRKRASRSRKVFRIVVFLLFSACFLYQVIRFLLYWLEYPTVVNIEITNPDTYMAPAFTFCNNERIQRSKYCEKYPLRCEEPDEAFCGKYTDYCGENITMVPKEEFYKARYEEKDVFELAHEFDDLVIDIDKSQDSEVDHEKVYRKRLFGEKEYSVCYTMNSRVESSLYPANVHKARFLKFNPYYKIIFDPQSSDSFDPISKDGVYFSVHSPFEAINPFQKGIFMKPGRMYKVTVMMQEEKLLPHPYKTDCLDYIELWKSNNYTGPRSQEMCRQKCFTHVTEYCGNCTFIEFLYPSSYGICDYEQFMEDYKNCDDDVKTFEAIGRCLIECKEECYFLKYTYDVQDRYVDLARTNSSIDTNIKHIYVDIDIDDTEILSFSYRPQYQEVEAFSYIGGFIGIWLGVSLVQITDFLESSFLIFCYFCKKKTSKKEEEANEIYHN